MLGGTSFEKSFEFVAEAISLAKEPAQSFSADAEDFIKNASQYIKDNGNVGILNEVIEKATAFKTSLDKEGYSAKTADLYAELAVSANILLDSAAYKEAKEKDPDISDICNYIGNVLLIVDDVPLTETGIEKVTAQIKLGDKFTELNEEQNLGLESLSIESENFIKTAEEYLEAHKDATEVAQLLMPFKVLNNGLKDGMTSGTADLAAKFVNEYTSFAKSDFVAQNKDPEFVKKITPFMDGLCNALKETECPGKSIEERRQDPANKSIAEAEKTFEFQFTTLFAAKAKNIYEKK